MSKTIDPYSKKWRNYLRWSVDMFHALYPDDKHNDAEIIEMVLDTLENNHVIKIVNDDTIEVRDGFSY